MKKPGIKMMNPYYYYACILTDTFDVLVSNNSI